MFKKLFDYIRYFISIAVLILFFGMSYLVLSNTYKSDEITEGESFHNLPPNTMDVLVLGSSHAQYSFSPVFFYEDTNLYSYVLGTPCQPLDVSYLMLKEGLKTQSPKLVILEVFTSMPLKSGCDGLTCYITAGFQMRNEEKIETLKLLPKDKYETYINPFVSYHNEWVNKEINLETEKNNILDTIQRLKEEESIDTSKIDKNFGYIPNYPSYPVENSWYASTTDDYLDVSLNQKDIDSLNAIKKLCDEKDIELLLYKTPIDSLDQENLSYLNQVWKWADDNDVEYIDFIKESPTIDFQLCIQSNSYHSYINGASLVTKELAKKVSEKHIDHQNNSLLDEYYNEYTGKLTISYLYYEYDANKYLERLESYDGPMLITYKGEKKVKKLLHKFNISTPTICLVDNNEIIDISDSCVGIEYKGKNLFSDYVTAEVDGEIFTNDCDLSIIVFTKDMDKHYQIKTNTTTMWRNGYNWYGE